MAFGLKQPCVVGVVRVATALPGSWRQCLTALTQMFAQEPAFEPMADFVPEARRDAFDVANVLAQLAGAAQRHCRIAVSDRHFLRLLPEACSQESIALRCYLPVSQASATLAALQWAGEAVNASLADAAAVGKPADWMEGLESQLDRFAEAGTNRFSILLTAYRLGISVSALTPNVVVLGQGKNARWMNSSVTDLTPAIGIRIAMDKHATASVLRAAGLPGPEHYRVSSAEAAVEIAQKMGFPVVVKPSDQEQGRGVAADLRSAEMVAQAWNQARAVSENILVERHADGRTHRLTVFQGRVIRVTQRVAAGVVGDGLQTIEALLALNNDRPLRRARGWQTEHSRVSLDDEALGLLAQNGLSPSSVPAEGQYVRLRRRDNISTGGENLKLALAQVHPDNIRLAEDAALLLKLDFAGIDLISRDLADSWLSNGAIICEVNSQPQLGANSHADAYEAILRGLVVGDGRVPLHLVICRDDPALHQRLAAKLPAQLGVSAVSSKHGLFREGARCSHAFSNGFAAAQALLHRWDLEAGACLMSPTEIASNGLPTDVFASAHWVSVGLEGEAQSGLIREVKSLIALHVKGNPENQAGLRSVTNK
jgi:cyanophycin synthetase